MTDNLKIQFVSGTPIYIQIYKYILRMINTGEWEPGKRLLPDIELAASLGVNHITLKKALSRLAKEGYLLRAPRRGTVVTSKIPENRTNNCGRRISLLLDTLPTPESFNRSFMNFGKGIMDMGLNLEVISANNSRTRQFQQIMELFSDPESAGCIVWSLMDMRQLSKLAAARPKNFPVVFINHKPELDINGIDFSGYDDFGAGRILGKMLNSKDFNRIIVCQGKEFRNRATNTNRIAGISASVNINVDVFSDYNSNQHDLLRQHIETVGKIKEKIAIVFISDIDYNYSLKILKNYPNIEPFVFFTAYKPSCHGIEFSCTEMDNNAIKIINSRRNGDNSFVINIHALGKLV